MHHCHGFWEDEYGICAHFACHLKRFVQFARAKKRNIDWIHTQRLTGLLSGLPLRLFSRMVRVRQYREFAKFRKYVLEQLNSLSRQLERQEGAAREITARLAQASDDAQRDRVAAEGK